MLARTLIAFPVEEAPGLRAQAAQLALGLAACGSEVHVIGTLGAWRHQLRREHIAASELDYPQESRQLSDLVSDFEPQVIHVFGASAAHYVLPMTTLVGATGIATLDHNDLPRIVPTDFRTAKVVFVSCEALHEQVARRLPSLSVITSGYLLPPAEEETPEPARQRFLAEELGLEEHAPVVVHADIFTGDAANTALQLIEAAPILAKHIPHIQLLIVGHGDRLGELEARAAAVNDQFGRRVVLLPGFRHDMSHILTLATVAVGSGHFAMEALGARVAVVAAGEAGILGTFTEETASVAQFTCCGRHGKLDPLTAKALASEIVGLLAYPEYRAQFATHGQEMVLAECERSIRTQQIAPCYQNSTIGGSVMRAPQRITIILPYDLRELLFTLPAVSGLRHRYPLAKITLVTIPTHQALLRRLSLADHVILKPAGIGQWCSYLRHQWHPHPDICLAFPGDFSSTWLAACSLAPHRLGFTDGGGSLFLSDHLSSRAPVSPSRAFSLMNSVGVSSGAPIRPPALCNETHEMVNQSLMPAGVEYSDDLILLCPQHETERDWTLEQWQALAGILVESRSERVAVLGSTHISWPEGVIKVMPVQDSMVLATLLARAKVVIAPESATLHLADLLNVATVGLYGPTSPMECRLPNPQSHPLCHSEYPCHPCGPRHCAEPHCLNAITPVEVARAVDDALFGPLPTP